MFLNAKKKRLKKTRRVLDAFANRIGSNTWQTVITNEGLHAVKSMLRKTASKNTAVSCHWIRSRARSEFLWVVGNKNKFNHEGVVPVNRTQKRINSDVQNDWRYLPLIQSLSAVAALLHDWGKATLLFQEKLKPSSHKTFKGDPIRHEWISTLLLNALVQSSGYSDEAWLNALINNEWSAEKLQRAVSTLTEKPLSQLPPVAKLVAWLIVSHHRLPCMQQPRNELRSCWLKKEVKSMDEMLDKVTKRWGYENLSEDNEARINECFTFPEGLLSQSTPWQLQLKKWAGRLSAQIEQAQQCMADNSYRLVLHHARLSLMLGDHFYSSQEASKNWKSEVKLFANTDRKTKQLKQKLDEHLVGVCAQAVKTAYRLPEFEIAPPKVERIKFPVSKSGSSFAWQDKAVVEISTWKEKTKKEKQGFFAVNMASTGKGKTFANAKIMRALSDDGESLRFILALGLRTLTLQTGDEYRERVGLASDELAVLIGSSAVKALHNQRQNFPIESREETAGSESEETLLDEDIDFDCDISEEGLATILTNQKDRQFLYAPVLACTIDHMMAATETKRGGRYILPSLRLLSSDLVIDEIDDFVGDDLKAIGRLIHLAGMLGRRVMISSATISPDIAEGYFNAYKEGWTLFTKTRVASALIGCAWIDEFSTQVLDHPASETMAAYAEQHAYFIEKRVAKLAKQVVKHKARVVSCQAIIDAFKNEGANDPEAVENKKQAYFKCIANTAVQFHSDHHQQDAKTSIAVSFGVVRMANISPCIALTRYMLNAQWAEDCEVRVMAYHSQQILLMRHEQEVHLDHVLKRKESAGDPPQAFSNPVIRHHIDSIHKKNTKIKKVIFILVATPVEEVGRDHDFDWAIVEPSSFRSIIQLAGRVRRHRAGTIEQPNIGLLQYNWKGLRDIKKPKARVFEKPGYELFASLPTHDLNKLIDTERVAERLDATPRITKPSTRSLRRPSTLAALEHHALQKWLTDYENKSPDDLQGYLVGHWFLSALAQVMSPFRQSEASTKLYFMLDENKDEYAFHEWAGEEYVNRQRPLQIELDALTQEEGEKLWLHRDYIYAIQSMAEKQGRSKRDMTKTFGEMNVTLRENERYCYNDQLGFYKKE